MKEKTAQEPQETQALQETQEAQVLQAPIEPQALIEEFNTLEDTLTVLLALKDTPPEREKVEEELLLAFAQFRTTLENLAEGENK